MASCERAWCNERERGTKGGRGRKRDHEGNTLHVKKPLAIVLFVFSAVGRLPQGGE